MSEASFTPCTWHLSISTPHLYSAKGKREEEGKDQGREEEGKEGGRNALDMLGPPRTEISSHLNTFIPSC